MTWVRFILIAMTGAVVWALALALALPAKANVEGRYASIIVDAGDLEVLHARQIDSLRHPASLTKIMTLYVTFEALERGDLTLDQSVRVSGYAAQTAPVTMGLMRGQSVRIDTLIQAVAVRSSNDAAVVLAEAVAGSEERFVDIMNATALSLGMRRTQFQNPHGLPDARQVTTARDMAKLALATMTKFPQYYHYFGQTHFRGRANTNKLLQDRSDVDGFKTGYTNASGYNLVISAIRNGKRIVAIVLGGASSGSRNAHMSDLIDRGFEVMQKAEQTVIMANAPQTIPIDQRQWSVQIDGFDSQAETAIHADRLVRHVGTGTPAPKIRQIGDKTWHSIRVDALDHITARSLCSDHSQILEIQPRRCKVLSRPSSG